MEFESFIKFVEFTERLRDQGPKRYLRDHSDPFRKYTRQEFFCRYRLTPETIKNYLVPLLEPYLKKSSKRGLPFAPEIMLLVSLRYYATGRFQNLGEDLNICQQSMSRIIALVSSTLANQMNRYVKFPSSIEAVKKNFNKIANFPGVIGCVDCTQIKIKNPGGPSAELYRNSEGWFSINVQAVTGPNLMFFDIVPRWPGSTDNNSIFDRSRIKQQLLDGELEGILLGSSGYELSSALMTPYPAPSNAAQERYNSSHIRTRNTIKQAFGVWKRRFPCLQVGMGIKLSTAISVICACAALHNIAIIHNDQAYALNKELTFETVQTESEYGNCDIDGYLAREDLVMSFFSN